MSIIQVAKAAGVSTATVSRVLNELPGVREDTVRRVHEAVEALSYTRLRSRPSRDSGATKSRRTGAIAVITVGEARDTLQKPVIAAVVAGIQRAATKFGLRLILEELLEYGKPRSLLHKRQFDGAIVFISSQIPVCSYDAALAALRQSMPVVWAMGMGMSAEKMDHVSPDNLRIGFIAQKYLREKGCEEMAFVTADGGYPFMRLRAQSFLNSTYDAGRPGIAYVTGLNAAVSDSYGQRVVHADTLDKLIGRLAAANPRPTGLFVGNDATTVQVYPLLAKHGLQVNRDITIVSCDNETVRLSALFPRPASIDIGAEEIGFRSVVRLRARLESPNDHPLVIEVMPRLCPGVTDRSDHDEIQSFDPAE